MRGVLVVILLVLVVVSLSTFSNSQEEDLIRVIISPANENALQAQSLKAQNMDVLVEREFKSFEGSIALVTKKQFEALQKNPNFRIERDLPLQAHLDVSVPNMNATNTWIRRENSHNLTGIGRSVCVIDSGIDSDHPGFDNRIVAQHCFCSGCCAGSANEANTAEDDHGHGTHAAGIVASNLTTYKGVAPQAGIVAVKVLNSAGGGNFADLVSAIDYCVANATNFNISVITMSLGGFNFDSPCDGSFPTTAAAVNAAVLQNITVIASTGNTNNISNITSPACVTNVTAVTAVDDSDSITAPGFSNRGILTEFAGPGVNIRSTAMGGGSQVRSGTSMAAPHVAGAFLLGYQKLWLDSNSVPTVLELEAAMNSTGVVIDDSAGSGYNFYRPNILGAIYALDVVAPTISFTSNTTENATTHLNSTAINVTISSSESIDTLILELTSSNGTITNSTLAGNVLDGWTTTVSDQNASISFRAFGNDSSGNTGVTDYRTIFYTNGPLWNLTPINYTSQEDNGSVNFTLAAYSATGTIQYVVNDTNITINSTSGLLNFTPPGNYSGVLLLNVSATNGQGNVSELITINITAVNDAPAISSVSNITVNVTQWVNFSVFATDIDNSTLNFSTNVSFLNKTEADLSANFSFRPTINDYGHYSFTVYALDGIANDSTTFNVSVIGDSNPINNAVNISNITGTSYGSIIINWSDVEGEAGESYIVFRATYNFSQVNLTNVTNLTSTRIDETVYTYEDVNILADNKTTYYYAIAAVDAAGNYNGSVISNRLAMSSNDTANPSSPTNLTISSSGSTTITLTLAWRNITSDVNSNNESFNNSYWIYKATTQPENLSGINFVNDSNATSFSLWKIVTSNSTTDSVSTAGTYSYHYIVVAYDDNNNTNLSFSGLNYENITFVVSAPASSNSGGSSGGSSSGGGGGGGGAAQPSIAGTASKLFTNLPSGSSSSFEIDDENNPVSLLKFTPNQDILSAKITISPLEDPQQTLDDTYKYIEIEHDFDDALVEDLELEFLVPKSFFESGYDEKKVYLNRYTNGWRRIPATLLGPVGSNFKYSASLPGLSLFAITAERIVMPEVEVNTTLEQNNKSKEDSSIPNNSSIMDQEDTSSSESIITIFGIIFIILCASAGFFYYYHKKHN